MRLKEFLAEQDVVKQALNLEEPEVGGKYPSEKIERYLDIIEKALDAMKKKEENDANDAIVADLRDKKNKWSNVDKETKPVKTKAPEAPPPEGKEPPVKEPPPQEEPPPEKEPPQPPEKKEIGPEQPKKKKKKVGEEKYADMLITPFERYMNEAKKLPNNITKALMKAIRDGKKSSWRTGFFRVTDTKVNDWLTTNLGLATDDNEHNLENAFIVDYNWTANEWVVK